MEDMEKRTDTAPARKRITIEHPLRTLLIYLLVVSLIAVPVTFSRFATTTSGSGAGTVANIVCDVTSLSNSAGVNITPESAGTYAFVAEFSVSNAGSEVSYSYYIDMKLSHTIDWDTPSALDTEIAMFASPADIAENGTVYTAPSATDSTTPATVTPTALTGATQFVNYSDNSQTSKAFVKGCVYFAFGTSQDNYTWYYYDASASSTPGEVQLGASDNQIEMLLADGEQTHYFKIVYFNAVKDSLVSSNLLYQLHYEQID